MRALLMVVLALTATACAAPLVAPTPHPFPRPGRVPDPTGTGPASVAVPATVGGYEISGTALALRGVPYRDGGADPNGFDCSGFVWYVFGSHKVPMPRTVAEQARWGQHVDAADLRPGDLVFFNTMASGPTHVGIVIGGDSFVHAPSSSGVVRVERISASYWSSRFLYARRAAAASGS